MTKPNRTRFAEALAGIAKCPTGIRGLDDITQGGLPRGRPTLVCGGAGSGKTLLAMEFIVRGIREFGEPGVFMAFEETAEELSQNVASLGFDVEDLIRRGKMAVDYVRVERSEIEMTGEYDLEGLFIRLGSMIAEVGAKRVAIDSLEALFAGLPDEGILRAELRRLFRWLKDKGVTAVITAEQGDNTLTRHGMEEYVSDCVIFLDHRLANQVATRRIRIVKYRGSGHGTNEYPTMIDERGLSVMPISSLGLDYPVVKERVSTGIERLDAMLAGKGYYKGSSILVSGTAGTGKSSIAAAFANSVCANSEKCLYFSFEEAPAQIARNMASIGINLKPWASKGLLKFHSARSTLYGLEQHLVVIHKLVSEFQPAAVVMDPITNLTSVGNVEEIKTMLTRVIDFLKGRLITTLFTSLTEGGLALERTDVGISSLMDTWLLLLAAESAGERNRTLYILKSRGMAHSNQMREFLLSDRGIELVDVYTGQGAIYTGAARKIQEAADRAEARAKQQAAERRQRELTQELLAVEAQEQALRSRLSSIQEELRFASAEEAARLKANGESRRLLAGMRRADGQPGRKRS
ncbi:MAG: circadian clock protein KaiC [Syntrophales bacterium]